MKNVFDQSSDEPFKYFKDFLHKARNLRVLDNSQGERSQYAAHELVLDSIIDHFSRFTLSNSITNETFRIIPAYIDDLSINALAMQGGNKVHFCGVNIGLVAAIYEFSMFCFAQKTTFKDIGDQSSEKSPQELYGYKPGFWMRNKGMMLKEAEFLDQSELFIPNDPFRVTAAAHLNLFMLRYIWLHEFYHCINGHTALIRDREIALCLNECGGEEIEKSHHDLIQSLELDADRTAFYIACGIKIQNRENLEHIQDLPLDYRLRLTIFAAYATTWLIDEYNNTEAQEEDLNHPPPYRRLHNLIRTLASHVKLDDIELKDVNDQVFEDIQNVADIIDTMPGVNTIISDMKSDNFQKWFEKYENHLDLVRADLAKYWYK